MPRNEKKHLPLLEVTADIESLLKALHLLLNNSKVSGVVVHLLPYAGLTGGTYNMLVHAALYHETQMWDSDSALDCSQQRLKESQGTLCQ